MLVYDKLVVEDFGPYRGRQVIDIPAQPGVTFILGDNGRGKTHLLNAFRYALLGKVYDRYGQAREDLASLCNSEARDERGHGQFSVTLHFSKDGIAYELTRSFGPAPRAPDRLVEALTLTRDGTPLARDAADVELGRVMPEQIQQFFLFDSELLSKYEALLDENDATGDRLKEAIERILGIPFLKHARTDAATVASDIAQQIEEAAKRHEESRTLAAEAESVRLTIEERTRNKRELEESIEKLESELERIEADMRETERQRGIITRRDLRRDELNQKELQLPAAEQELKELAAEAWRVPLEPVVSDLLSQTDRDLDQARLAHSKTTLEREMHRRLTHGDAHCPTCEQDLPESRRLSIIEKLASPSEEQLERTERLISDLARRKQRVTEMLGERGLHERIRQADVAVRNLQVAISDLEIEIAELEGRLGEDDGKGAADLAKRYSNTRSLLQSKRVELTTLGSDVEELKADQSQLTAQLSKVAGAAVDPALEPRREAAEQLEALFDEAIDTYRAKLKTEVERVATKLFVQMRHEDDYQELRINDQYGLEILHRDGSVITGRSAGEEQVVAFALLGALQRCAPVRGPIVVDMPFGRLDPSHRQRVIAALPEMTDQVILLAFEGEFDAQQARDDLGTHLVAEKRLERVTGLHTEVRSIR